MDLQISLINVIRTKIFNTPRDWLSYLQRLNRRLNI